MDAGVDATPPAQDPSRFRTVTEMSTGRYGHTMTRLADGRVVVVGGEDLDHVWTDSVEIFDPASERWAPAAALPEPRSNHVAVLLDSGEVLVIGGGPNTPIAQPLGGPEVMATVLRYDPVGNRWTGTGSLSTGRSHAQLVRTSGGRPMVIGGGSAAQFSPADCGGAPYCGPFAVPLSSSEIYDATSGTWTTAAPMSTARNSFTATALDDGRVVAAGGIDIKTSGFRSSELYDPVNDRWTAAPDLPGSFREHHAAALLGVGTVLVVGGKNPDVAPLRSVVAFDSAAQAWSQLQDLSAPRTVSLLVRLASGNVLSVGGFDQLAQLKGKPGNLTESLLFTPGASAAVMIGPLGTGRALHVGALLADGRVLVCGGVNDYVALPDCEIGEP